MPVPQPVSAPLSRAAVFLVVTIIPGSEKGAAVRLFSLSSGCPPGVCSPTRGSPEDSVHQC
jgi:hypothetical protein